MKASVLFISCFLLFITCKEESPVEQTEIVTAKEINFNDRLDVITFGSCSRQDEKQPLWKSIATEDPDLWVWSGDNIYGDSENMSVLKKKYDQQKGHPAYQRFLDSVGIIGIWDDHDYGVNNGGKEYPKKKESRDLMFDFLDVEKNNPAWSREGGYQSYVFGEADEQVKIILLDSRYFRDEPKRHATERKYIPSTGDILGEEQWQWFEKELMESEANLNIIVNGIQVIPEDHNYEKWANFPLSRDRLFNLVKSSKSNVLLISGDRHIGEISNLQNGDQDLYEITSSGLTHSWDNFPGEPNQHRVGEVVSSLNYGKLTIDWDANPIKVTAEIKGIDNISFEQIEFTLD